MTAQADVLFRQRTTCRPASISGRGIHTGTRVQLTLRPAPEGFGVRFRRTDRGVEIPAITERVSSLELATTLGFKDVTISTVEHLLAAVHVLGIDNLIVELDGPEVPILDGSAMPYVHLLEAVGVRSQSAWRRLVAVTAPIEATVDNKTIRIAPYPGLRLSYAIDFGNSIIGRQAIDLEVNRESFERELAPARTFALWSHVEAMRERGLALGGTSENCVVFDEHGPMNAELRYADEPVRHKALDALGDLALLGAPIWGHVTVDRGGHLLHYRLLEALRQQRDCWTWVSSQRAAEQARKVRPFPAPVATAPAELSNRRRRRADRPAQRRGGNPL